MVAIMRTTATPAPTTRNIVCEGGIVEVMGVVVSVVLVVYGHYAYLVLAAFMTIFHI